MFNRFSLCFVLIVGLLVAGCATNSIVPVYDLPDQPNGNGQKRQIVMHTVSDPHAFATTVQRSWLEDCAFVREKDANDWTWERWKDCHPVALEGTHVATSTGYISGLAGPALQAGGMVGAGALIGNGLSKSGSQTNVNQSNAGGTANATGGNASAFSFSRSSNTNTNTNTNTANGGAGGAGGCQGNCGGH